MKTKYHDFIWTTVIILGLVVIEGRNDAANYYIDYVNGNDVNNGASTNAPWKHCPGDPKATGVPASRAISPGDKLIFKGGISYILAAPFSSPAGTPGIALTWDGTAGNPITYDGNSDGTWGEGRAILTDNGGTNYISAFMKPPYGDINFINILNFEFGQIGGSLTIPADMGSAVRANPGYGIVGYGAFNNVTISNCYFNGLGYWFNQKPMSAGSLAGNGISCKGANNLTITNCDFRKTTAGITVLIPTLVNNLNIGNCHFTDYTVWGIDLAFQSATAQANNIFVHDCTWVNNDQNYSVEVWQGYGTPPHQNAIFFRGDSVTNVICGPNINFYNNSFVGTIGRSGGTSCIFINGNVSANIYNNLFVHNTAQNGAVTVHLSNTNTYYYLNVFNNTFYENGICALYGGVAGNSLNTNYNVKYLNNIICNTYSGYYGYSINITGGFMPPTNAFLIDYNCYISSNWNSRAVAIGATISQLGAAVTLSGMRKNSWEIHGMMIDPKFINVTNNDFHLRINTPVLGAGMNLSKYNFPGLLNDKDGNPRPIAGPWSMGAYEPIVKPEIPNNLRITAP